MSGLLYCRSEFTAPWALELPPMPGIPMLRAVTSGQAWVQVQDAAVLLKPGSLAMVAHGLGHVLSSEPGLRGVPLFGTIREQVSPRDKQSSPGRRGNSHRRPLRRVSVRSSGSGPAGFAFAQNPACANAGFRRIVMDRGHAQAITQEARVLRPGRETVVARRTRNPQIGIVVACIHRDPARTWSLDFLARQAGMSRSAFAACFTELVGEPAMQYVTCWRMYLALTSLREEEGMMVGELARRLGYNSEAAFSRALKRYTGLAPERARRSGPANITQFADR